MNDIVIGIDLGTTNTCAAYFKSGVVEILENSDGRRLTPSCVFFQKDSESRPVVGQFAKKMTEVVPSNGIYEIKRFVGRNFDEVKEKLEYFSFGVVDDDGVLTIEIDQESGVLHITPEEITALILAKIKKDVEGKLGIVSKAVITVPAYFNSAQREATLTAANQAGFSVLKLFNEPTAAALSYYFKSDDQEECYSLVYDLGGGTFDVSLLKRSFSCIDIVCVGGDTNLGGKDLDNLIIDYVCEELKRLHDYDPKNNRRVMRRLQNKCEEAKIELSTVGSTVITLDAFLSNETITIVFTREEFEQRASALFNKTISIVEKCLKDGRICKDQIKDVILAGGSSRIPKLQEILSGFFAGKNVTRFLNLDECVAEGAALQAALLSQNPVQAIKSLRITDVTRLSVGIADFVNRMEVVIPRNTALPASKSRRFFTTKDEQSFCEFKIFEGERLDVEKNHHIGTLRLGDLTEASPGDCEICVTFTVNNDGIMKVEAKEHLNVKEISVRYIPGAKSDEVTDADKEEDARFEEFTKKKKFLLKYCQAIHWNMRNLNLEEKYGAIYQLCEETFDNRDAMTIDGRKSPEEVLAEIQKKCERIFELYSFMDLPRLPVTQ